MKSFSVLNAEELPPHDACSDEVVYLIMPRGAGDGRYAERTDRNIGWITRDEQELLRRSTVSIAGCGGMGGLVASGLLRLGVGEIRLADPETFDLSNVNRQFAAKAGTVGRNKALETARELRSICDDTSVVVYPMGIREETVDAFVEGADLVCDLIEFWVVWYRVLLHERSRVRGVSLLNCNTVGHRTNLFLYTPDSMTMEEALGIDRSVADSLRDRSESGLSPEECDRVMSGMIRAVIPDGIPEYGVSGGYRTADTFRERLRVEGVASIVATNPVMAGGFLLNHVLFHLLGRSSTRRSLVLPPPMPGYLSFDAAMMESKVITGRWW